MILLLLLRAKNLCLICHKTISHFEASNLKRHQESNHKKIAPEFHPESELRRNKIKLLKFNLVTQLYSRMFYYL
jgi:hypothetical protein